MAPPCGSQGRSSSRTFPPPSPQQVPPTRSQRLGMGYRDHPNGAARPCFWPAEHRRVLGTVSPRPRPHPSLREGSGHNGLLGLPQLQEGPRGAGNSELSIGGSWQDADAVPPFGELDGISFAQFSCQPCPPNPPVISTGPPATASRMGPSLTFPPAGPLPWSRSTPAAAGSLARSHCCHARPRSPSKERDLGLCAHQRRSHVFTWGFWREHELCYQAELGHNAGSI